MGSSEANAYIALFRGINVGGKNRLPMKGLADILESLGCMKVATYIQSGNAVFLNPQRNRAVLAEAIGQNVMESCGFKPKVLLLDAAGLCEAVENNPFDTEEPKALHLFFLEALSESPDLEALEALKSDNEAFTLCQGVFYLYAPEGIGRSKLAAKVEKCLGVAVTARNWNTVRKLKEMIGKLDR